jgi:hypothetical protein
MITIPLQLPNDLARRVLPFQDRLAEILELGLRQVEMSGESEAGYPQTKQEVLDALASTGIVTLPAPGAHRKARARRTPIKADGTPASQMIISERRGNYE